MTKIIMGGEYLVWEGKQNFRVFCDFRGFRVIDLTKMNDVVYDMSHQQRHMITQ